jgi:hypothetical protein
MGISIGGIRRFDDMALASALERAAQLLDKARDLPASPAYVAFFRAVFLAGRTDFFAATLFAGFNCMVALARLAAFLADGCERVFRAAGATLR